MRAKVTTILIIGLIAIGGSYVWFDQTETIDRLKKLDFRTWRPDATRCQIPLPYSLGQIDSGFDLAAEEILPLIAEAASTWEQALDQDLFYHRPDQTDGIVINFVFDFRQAQVMAERQASQDLETYWTEYEADLAKYEAELNDHSVQVTAFNHLSQDYAESLEVFNTKVRTWSRRPGSETEYRTLKQTEAELKELFEHLASWQVDLNQTAGRLNEKRLALQTTYDQLAEQIDIHNQIFSRLGPITAGDTRYYTINVYQFRSQPELKILLAHELAHALGAEHVENPRSILYHQLKDQDFHQLKPTAEDLAEIRRVCGLD